MLVARQEVLTQSLDLSGGPEGRVQKGTLTRCKPRQGQPALAFGLRLASSPFWPCREHLPLFRGALADGRVEVMLCGDSSKLQSLIKILDEGPPLANVSGIEQQLLDWKALTGFTIG
jgi:hypothetical protein